MDFGVYLCFLYNTKSVRKAPRENHHSALSFPQLKSSAAILTVAAVEAAGAVVALTFFKRPAVLFISTTCEGIAPVHRGLRSLLVRPVVDAVDTYIYHPF